MEALASKELVEELKKEWRSLWRERIDDKVRAEGIADKDYGMLFVERGTVIFATRKFKMLSFREILQLHGVIDVDRVVGPHPSVGGWGKFIRTVIAPQRSSRLGRIKRARRYFEGEKQKQQLKKGGRGWLHRV
ncbi:hypothetical protein DRO44_02285 [Candidatus Bathyarchaeota archaeon]|nr:MAG: hypothetical protein DRO44_02285 [Candidatus Bathyarchaeota archaeon]